jgi:hypothetical protein
LMGIGACGVAGAYALYAFLAMSQISAKSGWADLGC